MKNWMKNLILLILAPFVLVGILGSTGYSFQNNSANFQCLVCHQVTGEHETELKVMGIPKRYKPGRIYNLKLTIDSTLQSFGEVQGGFAVGVTAGELIVKDNKGTQILNYILTHTAEGSEKRVWEFSWKAPQQKTDIELRVMAMAANGDFSPIGDAVAEQVFTINSGK